MKTINKFLLLLGGIAMTAGMTGCEDKRGEHLEDYASMVYFRNSGNQTITLYRVGENPVYEVPVCKSGSDLSYSAEATVVAVDQAQLDIYNMENNSNYVQIPDSCFKFETETKLHFAPGETSKVVKVRLFTDDISILQQTYPQNGYILALQVYSDRQVSPNINLLILEPEITIPVISFAEAGMFTNFLNPNSPAVTNIPGEVVFDMDNIWDAPFTCTLGIHDQAWLDAYNAKNGTEYELMAAANYKVEPTLTFTPNSNKVDFNVEVITENMGLFTDYIVPIYLADCEKTLPATPDQKMFKLDDDVFIVHAMYTPTLNKIALTESMLSTPYTQDGDGTGIPALVDGRDDSFWHSLYSGTIPAGDPIYGVYIDIALDAPLTAVRFRYQTRPNNGNGCPTHICIGASNDGQNWTLIQDITEGLPKNNNEWAEDLPIANAKTEYRYFRFGVAQSKGGNCTTANPSFTALGELELYGI